MFLKIIKSRLLIWLILAIPFLYICYGYYIDALFYGEVVHLSGKISIQLLLLSLFITPFIRSFPSWGFSKWLLVSRRYFGVASFIYALMHTVIYLNQINNLDRIFQDFKGLDYLSGWIALIIFMILAITSNNYSQKLMRRNWKKLHRTVYLATALIFAHWILTAFDRSTATAYLLVLSVVELYRIWNYRKKLLF
tara:strand:+ start:38821 stop:39402 length:582 start_codon:yes stop_codon:yes gene_type:complete